MLHLYVDSAVRADVEPLLETGLFTGITTNPVLLQRAGLTPADVPEIYRWATAAGAQRVFAQCWGDTADELTDSALRLFEIGERMAVKVVATQAGFTAAARLTRAGHPVLVTAVYNAAQAVLAGAAGAAFIAPYLGRLDDAGRPGQDEIGRMQEALRATQSATEILVASIRRPADVVALARRGVRHHTFAPRVAAEFLDEPLTADAVAGFDAAIRQMLQPAD